MLRCPLASFSDITVQSISYDDVILLYKKGFQNNWKPFLYT